MSIPSHTKLFTEVDRTSDPDFFVRFMDEAQKPAAIQTSKQLMLEHLNPPFARIDDPTERLFATSIQIGAVPTAFLTGTTATAVGTAVQYRFTATGRFLVMCVNRNHGLSNWMFGFVTVVGQGVDQP